MNDDPIEQEEARLRERLAKLAALKQLARELNVSVSIPSPSASVPLNQAPALVLPPESKQVVPGNNFDGTIRSLIDCYRINEKSPFHQLKHSVRGNYGTSFNRLMKHGVGEERIADWNADIVQNRYDKLWAINGKVANGHDMIAKLRLLCSFGATVLNDDACIRLGGILGAMRFPVSKASGERLTRDQARAIRVAARTHFGWASIALAQAFQVDCLALRQMDVIGEWVPISEPGTSEIVKGNEKWVRGLRWSDIDDNMILHRTLTSGRGDQQRQVTYNLKGATMVMEEINRIPVENRRGAMIVCENTGLPWSAAEFRRKWRMVADKAGVPSSIKYRDGRPSQSSENGEPELGADTAL